MLVPKATKEEPTNTQILQLLSSAPGRICQVRVPTPPPWGSYHEQNRGKTGVPVGKVSLIWGRMLWWSVHELEPFSY